MKRFYLVTILVLAAILGLSPFVTGWILKRHLTQYISIINSNGVADLSLVNYKLGYLHSTAKMKVKPGVILQNDPRLKAVAESENGALFVNLDISHGPLVYNPIEKRYSLAHGSVSGFASLPDQIEKFVFGKEQKKGFMQFDIVSSFGGTWFSQFIAPAENLPGPPGVTAKWGGIDAVFHSKMNANNIAQYYLKFKMNPILLTGKVNDKPIPEVKIEPITYESSMEGSKKSEFKSRLEAPLVLINNPKPVFDLENFKQTQMVTFNEENNKLDMKSIISLSKFLFPGVLSFQLDNSSYYLTVKNLNLQEFKDFSNYTRSIKRKMTDEELKQLQSLIPKIVSSESYITSDIGITSPDGVLIVNTKINWQKPVEEAMNVQSLLMQANITNAIRVSKPLLDKIISQGSGVINGTNRNNADLNAQLQQMAQQMLASFVEQGYLKIDKNDYITYLEYNDGKLKANGKDVAPPKPASAG